MNAVTLIKKLCQESPLMVVSSLEVCRWRSWGGSLANEISCMYVQKHKVISVSLSLADHTC